MNKLKKIFLLLTILFLICGCASKEDENVDDKNDDYSKNEIEVLSNASDSLTVWSVYWDCVDDIDAIDDELDKINNVSLFAAYFINGELSIPDETSRMLNKIKNHDKKNNIKVYLSIVNDVVDNEATTQKDTEILKDLLKDESSINEHANHLINLVKDNGYDGVEIDYEKIRSDLALWENFMMFEKELISLANKQNLGVRIILEPSTPVEDIEFVDGCEYVVMCYNLYGNGTNPGPKANYDFLKQMYEKFSVLPNISFALANGGYRWEKGTEIATQYSFNDINNIILEYGVTPYRDNDSGALYFDYSIDGKNYTMWYADDETIKSWAEYLNSLSNKKVNISLWRL